MKREGSFKTFVNSPSLQTLDNNLKKRFPVLKKACHRRPQKASYVAN